MLIKYNINHNGPENGTTNLPIMRSAVWVTDDYISLPNDLIGPNSSVMHISKMFDFGNRSQDKVILYNLNLLLNKQ